MTRGGRQSPHSLLWLAAMPGLGVFDGVQAMTIESGHDVHITAIEEHGIAWAAVTCVLLELGGAVNPNLLRPETAPVPYCLRVLLQAEHTTYLQRRR